MTTCTSIWITRVVIISNHQDHNVNTRHAVHLLMRRQWEAVGVMNVNYFKWKLRIEALSWRQLTWVVWSEAEQLLFNLPVETSTFRHTFPLRTHLLLSVRLFQHPTKQRGKRGKTGITTSISPPTEEHGHLRWVFPPSLASNLRPVMCYLTGLQLTAKLTLSSRLTTAVVASLRYTCDKCILSAQHGDKSRVKINFVQDTAVGIWNENLDTRRVLWLGLEKLVIVTPVQSCHYV